MKATEIFLEQARVEVPVICGAMYPCSNPELVGAVAAAGALAIVQPLSLIYVYQRDFRAGLQEIHRLSGGRPFGMNVLTEQSSTTYLNRMKRWVDIALEEGCRFFVTALGNPRWIVERVRPLGGIVYHDVTERKWALKARDAGVDGLICVNRSAGGHTGVRSSAELYQELSDLSLPLVCAGGVGREEDFVLELQRGYAAVQMGTRFIATKECAAHEDYKRAIVQAHVQDIVLTDRVTGVPISVINTPFVKKIGTHAGPLARWMLKHPRFKHWARLWYSLNSLRTLSRASLKGLGYRDYWQAGRSVEFIQSVVPVKELVDSFRRAWETTRLKETL